MAEKGKLPTMDPLQGRESLEHDLPVVLTVLGHASLAEAGWVKADALTLLIPVSGIIGERVDHYLLKLGFHAYRAWPPSAQFVNPETRGYKYPEDIHHVPILESPEIHVHPQYGAQGRHIQLICCSATLEFYQVLHTVEDKHIWDERKFTFLTTITSITGALQSPHYKGRQPKP